MIGMGFAPIAWPTAPKPLVAVDALEQTIVAPALPTITVTGNGTATAVAVARLAAVAATMAAALGLLETPLPGVVTVGGNLTVSNAFSHSGGTFNTTGAVSITHSVPSARPVVVRSGTPA